MNIVKLKPCPFCGKTPKPMARVDSLDGYFAAVSCFGGRCISHAYASSKSAISKHDALQKAISIWNTRAEFLDEQCIDFDINQFIHEPPEEAFITQFKKRRAVMPKIETRFYCNICNAFYFKEQDAIECEYSHRYPKEVVDPIYTKGDGKNQCPESVLIKFDGSDLNVRYYRHK